MRSTYRGPERRKHPRFEIGGTLTGLVTTRFYGRFIANFQVIDLSVKGLKLKLDDVSQLRVRQSYAIKLNYAGTQVKCNAKCTRVGNADACFEIQRESDQFLAAKDTLIEMLSSSPA